jgi:HK97 family phage major capsid protein
MTILGRPVVSSSRMPAATTGLKAVAFGDFSYFWIGERDGMGVQRLNELYAASGLVGFRGMRRVDSELTQAEAVKHLIMG